MPMIFMILLNDSNSHPVFSGFLTTSRNSRSRLPGGNLLIRAAQHSCDREVLLSCTWRDAIELLKIVAEEHANHPKTDHQILIFLPPLPMNPWPRSSANHSDPDLEDTSAAIQFSPRASRKVPVSPCAFWPSFFVSSFCSSNLSRPSKSELGMLNSGASAGVLEGSDGALEPVLQGAPTFQ